MSVIKKGLALGLTMAIGVPAAGAAYVRVTNKIPSFLLNPVDQLPDMLPQESESLVCAADTINCTRQNALGVLANRSQIQVSLSDINPSATQALIAAEDRRFLSNNGVDGRGVSRAVSGFINTQELRQGGSGITSQLAGILFPPATPAELKSEGVIQKLGGNNTSLIRRFIPPIGFLKKLKAVYTNENVTAIAEEYHEDRIALKLDQVYTKNQQLEMYFNNAYFGRGAYGIEAAAQAYFGVSASELTLEQSAVLVGALPHPSDMDVDTTDTTSDQYKAEYSLLLGNYFRVIKALENSGFSNEELGALRYQTDDNGNLIYKKLNLKPFQAPKQNDMHVAERYGAQHFVELIRQQAADILHIPVDQLTKGYKIQTTLNLGDQAALYAAIVNDPYIRGTELDAAAVSLGKDGNVVAMVGGKNFDQSQVNKAVGREGGGGGRPAGSSFKGIALAVALENGWSLDTMVNVGQRVIIPGVNGSEPLAVDPSSAGLQQQMMTLQSVIETSNNAGVAQIIKAFGLQPFLDKLKAMGITQPVQYPSLVLGAGEYSPLELATAYNGLVLNEGKATQSYTISSITDIHGNLVYQNSIKVGKQVFSTHIADLTTQALIGVVTRGTAKGAFTPPHGPTSAAGKTGTTGSFEGSDDSTDAWFTVSVCGSDGQARTASVRMGNPRGLIPNPNLKSFNAAKLLGRYITTRPDQSAACSL